MDVDEIGWHVDVSQKKGDECWCPHEHGLGWMHGWNIDEHRWIWMGMDLQKITSLRTWMNINNVDEHR